ncbi:MAG: restriction endonuclease subunit S [Succinivibrionaceae bacterium]|nr:restriction endonuclease subunit S [Succinivibrionaceae bacterium]
MFDIHSSKKKFNANTVKFDGGYPYVARGASNNGIRGYITQSEEYLNNGKTLSIGQDTGTVFYQEYPFFTGDKIKVAELKREQLTEHRAMYLIVSIRKKFGEFKWGADSFNEGVIRSLPLLLPINQNNEIDYDYIASFIRAIQKLTIRSVVDWKERVIKETKCVIVN